MYIYNIYILQYCPGTEAAVNYTSWKPGVTIAPESDLECLSVDLTENSEWVNVACGNTLGLFVCEGLDKPDITTPITSPTVTMVTTVGTPATSSQPEGTCKTEVLHNQLRGHFLSIFCNLMQLLQIGHKFTTMALIKYVRNRM